VQFVGRSIVPREEEQPERCLGNEQRLGQGEQVNGCPAEERAAPVRDEPEDAGEETAGDDGVREIAMGLDHRASLPRVPNPGRVDLVPAADVLPGAL